MVITYHLKTPQQIQKNKFVKMMIKWKKKAKNETEVHEEPK